MTTYYVGKGGSDSANGLSWANRKLTLNGAEDIPVVAGDIVYVGPGIYRELFLLDVSGNAGSYISYIGDVTGAYTDGVGGRVIISGSDDDTTITRSYGIQGSQKDFRRFYNLSVEMTGSICMDFGEAQGIVVNACSISNYNNSTGSGIVCSGISDSGAIFSVFNSVFTGGASCVAFTAASDVSLNSSSSIQNCIFIASQVGTNKTSIRTVNVHNFTVKSCTFIGGAGGVFSTSIPASGLSVTNSLFLGVGNAIVASASGEIVEDYNSIYNCEVPRTLVSTGSNSDERFMYPKEAALSSGIKLPYNMLYLSQLSTLKDIGTVSGGVKDVYGLFRPVTDSKCSRGAAQFNNVPVRETTTVQGSSVASLKLADATRYQIFVPVTAQSTTITVYCYREANYAGTLPQMVIREPGQVDRITTDTGSSGTWNQLSDTFTPSGNVDYVIVELVSNNSATSGSYAVYFDTVEGV
jgi:hypothetical protein